MKFRLDLNGDRDIAGRWVGYAKARMKNILRILSASPRKIFSEHIALPGVKIFIDVQSGMNYIRISAEGKKETIIVAWVGQWTNDFIKKYYDLKGQELTVTEVQAKGWNITDDGKYYQIPESPDPHYADPDSYTFLFDGGGAGIPVGADNIGRDCKQQSGKTIRVIMGTVGENLMTTGYSLDATWKYLIHADSMLMWTYNQRFPRHSLVRYSGDSAIYIYSGMGSIGSDGVATQNLRLGGFWGDEVGVVNRLYKKVLATGVKTYTSFPTIGADPSPVLAASCKDYPDEREAQDVIRVNMYESTEPGVLKSEPAWHEQYSFALPSTLLNTLERCPDDNSYFILGSNISGGPNFDPITGFMTDSKLSTIGNDVMIPADIKHDGSLTYVRIEKTNQMTEMNQGVYCAGELIEESGWQTVFKLLKDDDIPGDENGPLYIPQTRYRIISSHHGKEFDAVFYRKTIYITTDNELIPGYRSLNNKMGFYGDIRKTRIRTSTTWHLAVNGEVYNFEGYQFLVDEYILSTASVSQPIGTTVGYSGLPWINTVGVGNVNLSRPFTSESGGQFLFVVDVFPKTITHINDLDGSSYRQVYDVVASGQPWPCSDDYAPENVSDRIQWLFDAGGSKIQEVPNFINDADGAMWERVNAISIMRG